MGDGIFAQLREKVADLGNNEYFEFDQSVQYYSSTSFCKIVNIYKTSPVYGIVDGNSNTVWTNNAYESKYTYVSVTFKKYPITITEYSIETCCNAPNELIVEGTNDGLKWYQIDHITTPLETNKIQRFQCQHPGTFRTIKITQIGGNTANKEQRLLLKEIEFYGKLGKFSQLYNCTKSYCILNFHFSTVLFHIFYLL